MGTGGQCPQMDSRQRVTDDSKLEEVPAPKISESSKRMRWHAKASKTAMEHTPYLFPASLRFLRPSAILSSRTSRFWYASTSKLAN